MKEGIRDFTGDRRELSRSKSSGGRIVRVISRVGVGLGQG